MVHLRVIDEAGNPIAGVEVQLLAKTTFRPSDIGTHLRFQGLHQIVTDADGRFQTPYPMTRLASYSVEARSRAHKLTTVRVPAAETTADRVTVPDITLAPFEK
jgi:hypothetical protein